MRGGFRFSEAAGAETGRARLRWPPRLRDGFALLPAVLLGALVLLPIYYLVVASVDSDSGYSLTNIVRVFTIRRFQTALINSFVLGIACSVGGVLLGTLLAWLVSRTDMPLRRLIRACVLGGFAVPSFVTALAWVLLAGPNAGWLNRLWMAATGATQGLVDIFTLPGLVFVSLTTVYPLAFIFMQSAFEAIDTEMEHAARMLGAGRWRAFLTITLPLTRPAMTAALIMTFLETLGVYGAPAVIGVPARVYVVTTQVWSLFEYPPQIGAAAALSLPLVVITALLLAAQRRLVGKRSFVTVRGKGGRWERVALGRLRWPAAALALLIVVVTFILPNGVLVVTSLYRETYSSLSFSGLTLANYAYVTLQYVDGIPSIINSLTTAFGAATMTILIALWVAVAARRSGGRLASFLGFVSMVPLAIPSMVFAIGLVAAYSTGRIALYGTLWILALAYITISLPYGYMTCSTALASLSVDLENAARVLGASSRRVLRDITVPLMGGSILAGWIVVFANSLKELSASVLLYTSKTTVIATAIMDVYYASAWGAVAALSVILLIMNALAITVGYWLLGRATTYGNG